jgi:Ca-activated chloride channel family protein
MSELPFALHFLRPGWLLALLPLPLLLWRWSRRARGDHALDACVDAALRAHVTDAGPGRSLLAPAAWMASLWVLCTLALAGPAWRQQEVALYRVQAPLVVALDLSTHMAADDLKPDRITQARFKLMGLLKERAGGQVALIVYAGDAFTVAPLTDDANTVSAMVEALSPALMPIDGQRADLALARAQRLLVDGGFHGGDIVLIGDRVDAAAVEKARALATQGIRVSALGVGTAAGAMLRDANGGLVYDAQGAPQLARLDESALQALSVAGGGRYARLRPDNADLIALQLLQPRESQPGAAHVSGDQATRWRDEGPWLLPLVLALALLGFRRGALAVLVGLAVLLPPQPAQALDWDALWRSREQRADAALRAGDAERARQLARDPARAGAAAYRAGDWDAAIAQWSQLQDAQSHYNLGNALAQAGRLDEAIGAYDRALARDPDLSDASHNRELVEQRRKQSQPPPDGKDGQKGDGASEQTQGGAGQDNGEPGQSGPSDSGAGDGAQNADRAQGEGGEGKAGDADSKPSEGDAPSDAAGSNADGASADAAPADAKADAANQQAVSDAMSQALADGDAGTDAARDGGVEGAVLSPAQRQQREQQQAVEAWLRRVPDDPGGLLRRKFRIEYERRQAEGGQE